MLDNKSVVELRGIAQALDIPDVFQKDRPQLLQAIGLKQQALIPVPQVEIPKPQYDARLMTKSPSRKSNRMEIEDLLKPFTDRGMHLKFTDEMWEMSHGKKNDQGTLRMPLRTVLYCARKIME